MSHPQPSAQCARFLREELPGAEVRETPTSTADAVRQVSARTSRWAALGAASAAEIYDCVVLPRRSRGRARTTSRGSLARARRACAPTATEPWRTTLIFSELGADHPAPWSTRSMRSPNRRGQHDPDRVTAAALRARPLHVLHRPRRRRRRTRPSPRRSARSATRRRTSACSAATRLRTGPLPLRLVAAARD